MVSMEQLEGQVAAGYDRAITVFSPNGRLYQVEYAREAVQRGTVSLGIKYAGGVALAVDKNITDSLVIANSIEKIYEIDKHVGFATTGLLADGRRLVDKARIDCQSYRMTYGEAITVESLTKKLTDHMQLYTQIGGLRPFGVALLIGGVDDNSTSHLYETDPSGSFWEYTATAIGDGSDKIKEILRKEYRPDLTKPEAVDLALRAMYRGTQEQFNSDSIEISTIDSRTKRYYSFSDGEVKKQIEMTLEGMKKKKK